MEYVCFSWRKTTFSSCIFLIYDSFFIDKKFILTNNVIMSPCYCANDVDVFANDVILGATAKKSPSRLFKYVTVYSNTRIKYY